jgi:transposase
MSDNSTTSKTKPFDNGSQEPRHKRQKTSPYPKNIDIVTSPKGDMLIQLGSDGDDMGLVRAHKAILMMVSPVLAELLSKVSTCEANNHDQEVIVLDCDRTAFMDFCMVLHHQSTGKRAVPPSRFAAIAVVMHKYGCTTLCEILLCSRFENCLVQHWI